MPMQVLAGEGEHLVFVMLGGLLGGIVVTGLGLAGFLRSEFS